MKKRRNKRGKPAIPQSKPETQNIAGNANHRAGDEKSDALPPLTRASGSETNPEFNTISSETTCKPKQEHWSIKTLAFLAAVGGFFAAIFTGFQWWIAWDTELVTNQPSIVATGFRLITFSDVSEKPRRWQVAPIIENTGNTPTRNFRYMTKIGLCIPPNPTKEALDDALGWRNAPKTSFFRSVIGPKAEITGSTFTLGSVAVINCGWDVVGVGVLKFSDIFNYPHLVEFCTFGRFPPVDFQNYPIGQPVRIQGFSCDFHNCTDDECGSDWKERAKN